MASLLGLMSAAAFVKETTFGTPVTTTKGMPLVSEDLKLDVATVEGAAVKGAGMLHATSQARGGPIQGGGPIATYLFSSGQAWLWEAILGTSATTGAGPYVHTAKLARVLPSYSAQVAMGGTTSKVKKVEGLKIVSADLTVTLGEPVGLGLTTVYENEVIVTATALAGTFPTGQLFFLAQEAAITINSVAYCMQSAKVTINNNLKIEGCLGTRFISDPVRNGEPTITGEVTMKVDDVDLVLYNAFVAKTVLPMVWTFTEGTKTQVITSTVRVDGTSPTFSGREELMVTYPFRVVRDDLNSGTDDLAWSVVTTNSDAIA